MTELICEHCGVISETGSAEAPSVGLTSVPSLFRKLPVQEQLTMLECLSRDWLTNMVGTPLSHSSLWKSDLRAAVITYTLSLSSMVLRLIQLDENGEDASDIAELDRIIHS